MFTPVIGGKRERIAGALREEIRRGRLLPGEQLQGEAELARRFNVSRGTVRHALDDLKRERLITTRAGVGSFVTFDGVPLDQAAGWANAIAGVDRGVTTEVLSIRPIRWTYLQDAALGVAGDLDVDAVEIARVRRLPDGTAVSYERSVVPATGRLVDLPVSGLPDGSLTRALADAGLVAARGRQGVTVDRLDDDTARLLGREPGEAFLRTERTSYAADGTFVEHVDSLLDPAHFRLSLVFGEVDR